MKEKYELIYDELQNIEATSKDIEWDNLFRLYLNENREQSLGIISYTEYHILHKADLIIEA